MEWLTERLNTGQFDWFLTLNLKPMKEARIEHQAIILFPFARYVSIEYQHEAKKCVHIFAQPVTV